jgi:hypothetical protein
MFPGSMPGQLVLLRMTQACLKNWGNLLMFGEQISTLMKIVMKLSSNFQ